MSIKLRLINNFKQRLILCGLIVAVVGLFGIVKTNQTVAQVAGQFLLVQGDVSVRDSNGKSQKATKGLSFNSGDEIVTRKSSMAQIKMQDNGMISVRQDSELEITNFRYTRDVKTDAVAFKLLKGSFRSVTGLIGINNKANYLVTTPTATIGVRGTDHEPMYIPLSGWSGAPGRKPGTYDRVYSGKTILTTRTSSNNDQQIEILPNQVGFVPEDKEDVAPKLIDLDSFLNNYYDDSDNDNLGQALKGRNRRNIDKKPKAADDYSRILFNEDASDPLTAYIKQSLSHKVGGNLKEYTIDSSTRNLDGSYSVIYVNKNKPDVRLKVKIPAPRDGSQNPTDSDSSDASVGGSVIDSPFNQKFDQISR